jgi:sugar/nucleoside kinase (ribokinase family)
VPRYDYVAVGHVTADVLAADGTRHANPTGQPGGTAFYSALQAARLELRTQILTQGDPPEIERLLAPYRDELDLAILPAEHTTTLRTWGEGPARRQRLLAWAGPIAAVEVDTAILHLAPVARETPRAWRGRAEFVGLTPQGLLREWDARGDLALAPAPRELLPARCDAVVLSEREWDVAASGCAEPAGGCAGGGVVAVTAGPHPVTLHLPGGELLHVPVPAVERPRDDLGAGDVFAAALFVALREGRPPAAAAAFAAAAAAVRIGGAGPGAIGDRRAIAARLETHGSTDPPL